MIRVLIYVAVVFAFAAGFAWLAEWPGTLTISWRGYEIRTSLMVAAAAVALLFAAIIVVGTILRVVVRTPRAVGQLLGARRRDRGYRALSRGMIAVGAGDARTARRAAQESQSLLGKEPLVLLLAAQAAQIGGDRTAARTAFEALSEAAETKVLGLHGLFVEARRQGEHTAARHFAEEAARIAPHTPWAGTALFDYQCQAGDWQGALTTLTANADARIVDAVKAKRLRAVLLTARAMELEAGHPDEARTLAVEAHRLAPDLAPAATTAARLLTRAGDIGRATRLLETAWKAAPHPEIAEAYAQVRPGDSVRDRLKRVRRLADLRANHPEASLAVARAAIDAHEWQTARNALGGLTRAEPSERVCLLMAEIEEGEHGDQGRVRSWLKRALDARPDPVWTADGHVFDHWAPVSPISGRVDAFEWRVVADHAPRARAVEAEARMKPAALGPVEVKAETTVPKEAAAQPKAAAAKESAPQAKEPATKPAAPPSGTKRGDGSPAETPPVVQPSPDDPGPMAEDDEKRPFGVA